MLTLRLGLLSIFLEMYLMDGFCGLSTLMVLLDFLFVFTFTLGVVYIMDLLLTSTPEILG